MQFFSTSEEGEEEEEEPISKKTGSRFFNLQKEQEQKEEIHSEALRMQDAGRFTPPSIFVDPERENEIVKLHAENPTEYSIKALAVKFKFSYLRVKSILQLHKLAAVRGVDPEKVASGVDVMEHSNVVMLEEPITQEELDPDLETKRDPIYAFLDDTSDYVPGLFRPNSSRKKKKWSDHEDYYQVMKKQNDAKKTQLDAVEVLPCFSAFETGNFKFKIAVKDLSKPDAPLMIRDHQGVLRLATAEEARGRSWVKRPRAFDAYCEEMLKAGGVSEESEELSSS